MKRFLAALLLLVMVAAPFSPAVQIARAQSEAGFLDNEPPPGYSGYWGGQGWYCLGTDSVWSEEWQQFVPVTVLYAGPYSTNPGQQFCSQY